MDGTTRPISWVRAARKSYAEFPLPVQDRMNAALTIAAQGGKADIAKPLEGLGSRVMEVAVSFRRNAWRVVLRRGARRVTLSRPCLPEVQERHCNASLTLTLCGTALLDYERSLIHERNLSSGWSEAAATSFETWTILTPTSSRRRPSLRRTSLRRWTNAISPCVKPAASPTSLRRTSRGFETPTSADSPWIGSCACSPP